MTTLMQKYIGANREQKRKQMFLYVAREMTGRAIARSYKNKGKKFPN